MITQATDPAALAALAAELWPHHTAEALAEEFRGLLSRADARCFLKWENGCPVGFAQCQLRRDYVEGTSTSPVGYLEGIFVREPFRHRGYARELLAACEAWARQMGCTEFASDCELDNLASQQFHRSMHFREASRIVCFVKKL